MRARAPDETGYVARDGVRIAYESYGAGPATILMLPTWSVLDAAHGRFQLVDLARHYRVVTFDPRGNGRSDRPRGKTAYAAGEFVEDAVAVLDATGTDRAIVVACSLATRWVLELAAEYPERVLGAVASGTLLPLAPGHDVPEMGPFEEPYRTTDGWAKFNAHYWRDDYEGFLRFFFSEVWTEPYSERLIEACVANGLQTSPETLIDTVGTGALGAEDVVKLVRRTRCPWLVVHGDGDRLQPLERGMRLAEVADGSLVTLVGAGHCSGNRDPVRFNLLIRDFTDQLIGFRPRRQTWTRAQARPRRVLFVPADRAALERDVAIAGLLRERRPGLLVDWLVGEPLGAALRERGETIHAASSAMPSLSDPDEDAFESWWTRDEAAFLSFMVMLDVVDQQLPDLVVADGAFGIDHHLHENPELKRFAYAWLADRVAWVPGPEHDDRDRRRMADANAEMVAQVERYPRVRDRAFFLGSPDLLPDAALGPTLPSVLEWGRQHLAFPGPMGDGAAAVIADQLSELL